MRKEDNKIQLQNFVTYIHNIIYYLNGEVVLSLFT